jgi:hypothetical protein
VSGGRFFFWAGFLALMAASLWVVAPDPARLASGLPRLMGWLAGAWPPDFSGGADIARREIRLIPVSLSGSSSGRVSPKVGQAPWLAGSS